MTCSPLNLPMESYLYALIFIYGHLWESILFMRIFLNPFLFMIICENRSLLWESFWISSYLQSSMRISPFYENLLNVFLFMIICENRSFYENLVEFLLIYDHLWESLLFMRIFLNVFLFMIICENVCFLWESFWISSYLWSPVKIIPFYENLFEFLLIYDHLWESFSFMRIFLNLFLFFIMLTHLCVLILIFFYHSSIHLDQ